MNRISEANQTIMDSLFPKIIEHPTNSLKIAVLKRERIEEPIVLSIKYVGDENAIGIFKAEPQGNSVDIRATLWTEADMNTLEKNLVIGLEFKGLRNPLAKAVISGKNKTIQNDVIQGLYNITHFFLFIADEKGELIKLKRVNWSYIKHEAVLSQFTMHEVLH